MAKSTSSTFRKSVRLMPEDLMHRLTKWQTPHAGTYHRFGFIQFYNPSHAQPFLKEPVTVKVSQPDFAMSTASNEALDPAGPSMATIIQIMRGKFSMAVADQDRALEPDGDNAMASSSTVPVTISHSDSQGSVPKKFWHRREQAIMIKIACAADSYLL